MNLNRRIYTRFFSQHLIPTIAGFILLGLPFMPIAEVYFQYAVNQNLVFTLRYLAIFLLIIGFRGNYPSLKAIHKTTTVFVGIVPTAFLFLATIFILSLTLMTGFVTFFGGSLEISFLKSFIEGLVFWLISASITVGIWLLIIRGVFAQYKYPHDLDEKSKFASVAVLLMLFGSLGVHRFFVGKIVSGFLFLITMGFLGVGVIVDGIMLMMGRFKDAEGNAI